MFWPRFDRALAGENSTSTCWSPGNLLKVKRVEEEFVSGVRLAAPLRFEPQQDYAAFADVGFERGDLALDAIGAGQIAAGQRGPLARVAGEDLALEIRLRVERRAALEHHDCVRGQAGGQRVLGVFDVHRHQASGAE